jgi:hypothetical protein
VSLRAEPHLYVLQLLTELTELPSIVICIKCYDFEGPMNSSSRFVALNNIFIMTIILCFSDIVTEH